MKHFFTKFTLSAMVALGCISGRADVISPQQALARLESDTDRPAKARAIKNAATPQLVFTGYDTKACPAVYLFSNAEGFLLLSANDIAPALLGYGDGAVPADPAANPEFEWWLKEYARQMEYASALPSTMKLKTDSRRAPQLSPIAPMLTTKWNQSEPYNDLCPVYDGDRCVTGCVATAISQLMNYHQWPVRPSGSQTYYADFLREVVSLDFNTITFDWANMLHTYDATATEAQKKAVATLMYAAGVGAKMDYSPYASAAGDYDAGVGLGEFFGYQDGMIIYGRDYVPLADWDNLIHDQLERFGPVYYSGASNYGGHAFICDGYDGDGYFHINWGWGGMSDGYFLLDALDPDAQGIGGSTSGYDFTQFILGNVVPAKPGVPRQQIIPYMVCYDYTAKDASASLGSSVNFDCRIYNYSFSPISGTIAFRAEGSNGNNYYLYGPEIVDLSPNYGYYNFYATLPSSIPAGTYTLSPGVVGTDGLWYPSGVQAGCERTDKMTVSGNTVTFHNIDQATIGSSGLKVNTELHLGQEFSLSFSIINESSTDYIGYVFPAFLNDAYEPKIYGANYPVYLEAGDVKTVTDYRSDWFMGVGGPQPAPGTYYLCLADNYGNIISELLEVNVEEASVPVVSVSDFCVVGDPDAIQKEDLRFRATLNCESGYFSGMLRVAVFPYIPGEAVYADYFIYSSPLYLSGGESAQVDFAGNFSNGVDGKEYFAMVLHEGDFLSDQIFFTLAGGGSDNPDQSSVESVTATADSSRAVYYTLQGVRVEKPQHGIYIRVCGSEVKKVAL